MKEEWKKIDGYNGLYSVSNYGGVLNNKTGRVLDNPNNYYHVRFIDGDKMHHRADNLEWVYAEEY